MAKLFNIKLTQKDVVSEVTGKDGTNRTIRSIELEILETLFLVAVNSQKDHKKINICYDLIEEVKGIKDDTESLKITPSDLKELLIPAWEKTIDGRPGYWYYARAMFKSMENPEEIEV
ncbi:MAG: hypothetical protein IMZ53_14925 [Thermoplasmata archaeon]|nr:hypothetical protein [Thermoplasmata archaeon]MBE3141867.1 hypothetical protein [Thermoplasmata archaeon]